MVGWEGWVGGWKGVSRGKDMWMVECMRRGWVRGQWRGQVATVVVPERGICVEFPMNGRGME